MIDFQQLMFLRVFSLLSNAFVELTLINERTSIASVMKLEEAQRFALEENFDVIVSAVARIVKHEPCRQINRAPLLCLASGSKVGKPIVTPARDVIGKGQPKCSKTMAQYHNLKAEGVLQWTDMSCTRGKDNQEIQDRSGRAPQV